MLYTMDSNNLNIKTVHVCRTCREEIINTSFFHLDFPQFDSELTLGQKISNCIPELDLSIVPNTVICGKCADTINSLYIFKKECLQLEMQICEYIQQVHHTDNVIDLAAVMQFHQLHSKNLTAELTTEAFEKTEYKIEESTTSFCDNYVFNETDFNTFENFMNSGKSEAEENSDTHDDSSNIVQDCLLQVVEKPDSFIQNLNKTRIYYQCFTCGNKAESKLKLIRHLKSHRDKKLYRKKISSKSHKILLCWYRCELCNYSTKHKCLFNFHNRAHLTKKDYQGILKSSPILVNLSTNITTFAKKGSKNNKIKCGSFSSNKHNFKYRGKSLSNNSESKWHSNQRNVSKLAIDTNIIVNNMLTHTNEKPFTCTVCERSYNHKKSLKRHMLTHTHEKTFKCSVCEYSCNGKPILKRHMLTHTGEKPFKCGVCEYSCKQKMHLKRHILTHTGEKPFKCSVCEYSCIVKNNLKLHMLTHIGEKPFKCLVCQYSTIRKNDLKRHMLTHTGEKPFKCSICEYRCSQTGYLKDHMLTHTGNTGKLFKCSVCEFICRRKNNLKRHILMHRGEKPFKCAVCQYSSICRSHVKRHMQTHTREKPFKCSICEHSYKYRTNLKHHNMLTHSVRTDNPC